MELKKKKNPQNAPNTSNKIQKYIYSKFLQKIIDSFSQSVSQSFSQSKHQQQNTYTVEFRLKMHDPHRVTSMFILSVFYRLSYLKPLTCTLIILMNQIQRKGASTGRQGQYPKGLRCVYYHRKILFINAIILKHKHISTTGVTKVVVCAILTVGWCIL